MRRLSGFILTGLFLVTGTTGCGPSLGEPKQPTGQQMQAAKQIDATTNEIAQLKAKPDSAFNLYSMVMGIGPQAVDLSAKSRSALSLAPQDLPAGCVTGDGNSGYTYNCPQVTGSVKFSGNTTTIDLKIMASSQEASVEVTLKGAVTNDGSKITGDLTAESKVNSGINLPGLPNANVRSRVEYDISYQTAPKYCINAGKVKVEYSAATVNGVAQFEYTGCNAYLVRNG